MKEFHTLGEYLKHHREAKHLSIDQVASATKISPKTLLALEANAYDDLPAKPFVRGFVIAICRFIEINAEEVLQQFDPYIDEKIRQEKKNFQGYAFDKSDTENQNKNLLFVFIAGTTILSGALIFILKPKHHKKKHPQIQILEQSSSKPSAESVSSLEPTPIPVETPSPSPSELPGSNKADPLDSGLNIAKPKAKLFLSAHADIWVRYQVDHKPVRKFIIRKPNKLVLRCEESFQLEISHPEDVTLLLSVDNKKVPVTFSEKPLRRIIFPENADLPTLSQLPLPTFIPPKKSAD